jgi:hypothetical protein
VLTLAVTAALALTAPSPASTAPKKLTAQLGFIFFCKTSMSDVTARLGPGKRFHDGVFVWRGWYDPTARVYLLIAGWGGRGSKGTPLLFQAWLASESHKNSALDDVRLKAADLGRPRLSLTLLRGPKGIRLGDSRARVSEMLGGGELYARRGNVETYNYYNLRPAAPGGDCGEAGFHFQVSFTDGILTRIWIIEAS